MHRPARTPATALAALASLALLVAACGGSNVAQLTNANDPKEILTKSLESVQKLKTVHFQADVSGKVKIDLTGGAGATGTKPEVDLKGTGLSGDIDFGSKKFKATAFVPALFGLTADFVVIGSDQYTKISLTGPKWTKKTSEPSASASPMDTQSAIDDLKKGLDGLKTPPTKGADEKCGGKDCYTVTVPLSNADLAPLESAAGGGFSLTGDATLKVWVEKDTLHPVKLTIDANGGEMGTITVALTLTNFDANVAIDAPPADQIETASPSP